MNNTIKHDALQESILTGLMTRSSYHVDYLESTDFTGTYRQIFDVMKSLHVQGKPYDAVSLMESIPTAHHLDIMKRHAPETCASSLVELINTLKTRNLKATATTIIANKQNFTPQKVVDALEDLIKTQRSKINPRVEAQDLTAVHEEYINHLHRVKELESEYLGVRTFLPEIDSLAGGLCPSHLIVVAARPSMGKSAFGLYLIGQALLQKKNVLFYSTEMDVNTIMGRLLSQILGIPAAHLTTFPKRLSDRDLKLVAESKSELERVHVEVKFGAHVNHVYDKALLLKRQGKLDLLVVDYLQNLNGNGENPVEKLSHISNTLKKIAMDLEVPVVALAQLNRQAQHMDVPSMAEIKGSGTIEQDADLIFLLHHNQEEADNQYFLMCVKNRHGEIKNLPIIFDKQYQRFRADPSPNRFLGKKPRRDLH